METLKIDFSSDRTFSNNNNLPSNTIISENAQILGFTLDGFKIDLITMVNTKL